MIPEAFSALHSSVVLCSAVTLKAVVRHEIREHIPGVPLLQQKKTLPGAEIQLEGKLKK